LNGSNHEGEKQKVLLAQPCKKLSFSPRPSIKEKEEEKPQPKFSDELTNTQPLSGKKRIKNPDNLARNGKRKRNEKKTSTEDEKELLMAPDQLGSRTLGDLSSWPHHDLKFCGETPKQVPSVSDPGSCSKMA
jgi:hypothetical protein